MIKKITWNKKFRKSWKKLWEQKTSKNLQKITNFIQLITLNPRFRTMMWLLFRFNISLKLNQRLMYLNINLNIKHIISSTKIRYHLYFQTHLQLILLLIKVKDFLDLLNPHITQMILKISHFSRNLINPNFQPQNLSYNRKFVVIQWLSIALGNVPLGVWL